MTVLKKRLHDALIILTGHEDAKSRLSKAWIDGLDTVEPDEVPDGIREKFLAMRDRLCARQPVNKEHPVVATIRKMSPMEAARYNRDIVQMYAQLMAADQPMQLRLVESIDGEESIETDAVPDFLTQH
ncbi:MAG: hypothetical protein AAF270_07155 [Pseudomonadota bacterium]